MKSFYFSFSLFLPHPFLPGSSIYSTRQFNSIQLCIKIVCRLEEGKDKRNPFIRSFIFFSTLILLDDVTTVLSAQLSFSLLETGKSRTNQFKEQQEANSRILQRQSFSITPRGLSLIKTFSSASSSSSLLFSCDLINTT